MSYLKNVGILFLSVLLFNCNQNLITKSNDLISIGRYMGVKNGNIIKFYNGNGDWKYKPELDFKIKSGIDDLISIGSYMGVKNGT